MTWKQGYHRECLIRCSYYQLYQENRLPTVIHDLLNPRLKDLDVLEDPLVGIVTLTSIDMVAEYAHCSCSGTIGGDCKCTAG